MRWILVALLMMACAGAAASEMWRWVDERGVVHYSDRPHPGAERVDVKPAQSYQAPRVAPPSDTGEQASAGQSPAPFNYTRLAILSPAAGETLWNIGGQLNVSLVLEPALASGHELRVYFDGQRVSDLPAGATEFTLSEVYRGEHRLRAAVVDERGRERIASETVVFYVQQASIQRPNRPAPGPGGG